MRKSWHRGGALPGSIFGTFVPACGWHVLKTQYEPQFNQILDINTGKEESDTHAAINHESSAQ